MGRVITTQQLADMTDVPYMQLNRWTTHGVISCIGENEPGSGKKRQYDESVVHKVELLGKINLAFGNQLPYYVLKTIGDNYELGYVDVFSDARLSWEVK
jgi:hypothetical protein